MHTEYPIVVAGKTRLKRASRRAKRNSVHNHERERERVKNKRNPIQN